MDYPLSELPQREKDQILTAVAQILVRHDRISFAYAYGSFLEDGPFRDLDVALYLTRQPTDPLFLYEDRIQRELRSSIACPVPFDVRVINHASIVFQYHVYRGKLIFARDPEVHAQLVAYAVSRYLDIKPILEHHLREAFASGP